MKNKLLLFLLSIFAILNSCVTPKDTNYLQDIEKNYPKDDIAPLDYQIIPGDQLYLAVYTLNESTKKLFSMYSLRNINNNQLGSSMLEVGMGTGMGTGGQRGVRGVRDLPINALNVYPDGTVNIPYIGIVKVQDMTVQEAKKIISEKFENYYPDVSIDIALRNRYFFVLGEAGATPVEMSSLRMNIFQALAQSGTITKFGDRKSVKIVRQTSSGTEVKTFDLRSKDIVDSEYYYIQPNDVIYVQQLQRKFFGSITSFSSIFGFLSGLAGVVALIIKLSK